MALSINGIELDFDFTSPEDLTRYRVAMERMREIGQSIKDGVGGAESEESRSFDSYTKALDSVLRSFARFLDEVFGEGTAQRLLDEKLSLAKMTEIQNAISAGAEAQGKALEAHFTKYRPNRATRRQQ